MKVQKLFSLDMSIVQRLKEEDNASGLVNGLLKKHYDSFQSVTELEKKLKIIEIKEKHAKELEEFERSGIVN